MATITVTGTAGKLGRAVVTHLVEQGHEVHSVDRVGSTGYTPGFTAADLSDYGQTLEVLGSLDDRHGTVDAVVHLAAVPAPGLAANAALFENNAVSTYNVFAAARSLGIQRVVWASSETVLGLPFSADAPPPYLPVDEEYRPRPASSYSLSKLVGETIAEDFARWEPSMTFVGLRFSNVMEVDEYAGFTEWQADPSVRAWNAWGYIDARDGAQAVRRALEWDATGAHVFNIANADTVMLESSRTLAAQLFPDVELRGDVDGTGTLISIDKARRLLGYEPEHSWRDHAPLTDTV
ncbi:NAD-dependent epimerase/dehydratase family protein [Angustibacter aerolatus]